MLSSDSNQCKKLVLLTMKCLKRQAKNLYCEKVEIETKLEREGIDLFGEKELVKEFNFKIDKLNSCIAILKEIEKLLD